jgi:hypothetical protein
MNHIVKNILFSTLICIFLTACKVDRRVFPPVKDITVYKSTEFIPTMEDSLVLSKNTVYCSTFLYAWEQIKNELDPLMIMPEFTNLQRLNNSTSYQHSLEPDEMETSISVKARNITATASFKKSLPFVIKLKRILEPEHFKNEQVEFFGFDGNMKNLNLVSELVFYNNDSDFAIKLIPKDEAHEIILYCPSGSSFTTFQGIRDSLDKCIQSTIQNKQLNVYENNDIVRIPLLTFNIEKKYKNFVGNIFISNSTDYSIGVAQQRTAFILDEVGAEIESVATINLETAKQGDLAQPKHMIFNKPFLVMLKSKDAANPYFMAWIDNTELMTKK